MIKLVYNPNTSSIYLYIGDTFSTLFMMYLGNATYAASEDGLTYVISTVSGSTITTAMILPLVNTIIQIEPLTPIE